MTAVVSTLPAASRSRDIRPLARRTVLGLFVLGVAILIGAPVFFTQKLALQGNAAGYQRAFDRYDVWAAVWTTVKLATISSALAMVVGVWLAIAAARLPRSMRFLQVVPILTIVLPPLATVSGWLFLASPRTGYLNRWLRMLPWWNDLAVGPLDVNTVTWIIIVQSIGMSAFVYVFVRAGLRDTNAEAVEAARIAGLSERRAMTRITLPMIRPVLVYAFGTVFLIGLGQFTAPLLLGRQDGVEVLSTLLFRSMSSVPADYAVAAALGMPLLIFGVAVVLFQRLMLGNSSRFVTHAGKSFRSDNSTSWTAVGAILGFALIAIVLPGLAIVNTAFSPFWNGKIQPSSYTLDSFHRVFDDERLSSAVWTSVSCAIGAVLIALVIGFVVSSLIVSKSTHRAVRSSLDVLVAIPLAVPAVVIGAGFFFTFIDGPVSLYGSRWGIVAVYIALMIPFSVRMQLSALIATGTQYTEASRVSGRPPIRTSLAITLPMIRPALGGAAGVMFVLLSHEFSASLLVRSSRTHVMGTLLYDYFLNGSYTWVAVMAVLMGIITAVGLTLAVLLGGRRAFDQL